MKRSSTLGLCFAFGLVYWVLPKPVLAAVEGTTFGDFNNNGVVGVEDYPVWRAEYGASSGDSDGDGSGLVGAADHQVWKANYGFSAFSSVSSAGLPAAASATAFTDYADFFIEGKSTLDGFTTWTVSISLDIEFEGAVPDSQNTGLGNALGLELLLEVAPATLVPGSVQIAPLFSETLVGYQVVNVGDDPYAQDISDGPKTYTATTSQFGPGPVDAIFAPLGSGWLTQPSPFQYEVLQFRTAGVGLDASMGGVVAAYDPGNFEPTRDIPQVTATATLVPEPSAVMFVACSAVLGFLLRGVHRCLGADGNVAVGTQYY